MKKKLNNNQLYKLIILVLIIAFISVVVIEKITHPIPLTYDDAVKEVIKENGSVEIVFNDGVNNYEINDYGYYEEMGHQITVSAWHTPLGKYLNYNIKKALIEVENEKVNRIFYISDENNNDIIIYGEQILDGQRTLPRLAMNYYFILALFLSIIPILSLYVFNKNLTIIKIIKLTFAFSLSYIVSSIIMLGFNQETHFILRDLSYVMVASLLLSTIFYSLLPKTIIGIPNSFKI